MIRILLADDHGVVRKGLRYLLEQETGWEVAGEAADGREAVRLAECLQPEVAVLDIAMPQMNGIEAAGHIARISPKTCTLLLSMYADESYLLRALNNGVRGYLLKDAAEEDLVRAVKALLGGKSFFSPAIAAMLAEEYTRSMQSKGLEDSFELLSAREREVLQLLAEGKSNKEVAELLNISNSTIETHRQHIMQKLSLHNTAELVLYAVRKKIVT